MKHCILVKYKEGVDQKQKEELIPRIQALFDQLLGMEGIHKVELFPNVVDRPNRYDLLIRIEMDEEALSAYDSSEPHRKWKAEYAQYLEKKAIFDY